ncbi:hypothetical protein H0H81_007960 [Sphagnurus paluster]|uniref:Uncharacterized protein n=1 Tax=Sphagnurus paluster TaxID=117069 RepID=A0A9P7GLS5_9AGAR|nr:hypothetical protein H0H81_007960 [Sphagnurus paluster]
MPAKLNTGPSIPPVPGFSDLRFSVIGTPRLLKRISSPAADFDRRRSSLFSTNDESDDSSIVYATTSSRPPSRARMRRVERDSMDSLQRDMFAYTGSDLTDAEQQRPVVNLPSSLRPPTCSPTPVPGPSQVLQGVNMVLSASSCHDNFLRPEFQNVWSEPSTSLSSSATAKSHPKAATPPSNTVSQPTTSPTPSQFIRAQHFMLESSHQNAVLVFENAKRGLLLAQEIYEAAKAGVTATSTAKARSDALIRHLDECKHASDTPRAGTDTRDLSSTSSPSTGSSAAQIMGAVDHGILAELEKEADDVRLAWMSSGHHQVSTQDGTQVAGARSPPPRRDQDVELEQRSSGSDGEVRIKVEEDYAAQEAILRGVSGGTGSGEGERSDDTGWVGAGGWAFSRAMAMGMGPREWARVKRELSLDFGNRRTLGVIQSARHSPAQTPIAGGAVSICSRLAGSENDCGSNEGGRRSTTSWRSTMDMDSGWEEEGEGMDHAEARPGVLDDPAGNLGMSPSQQAEQLTEGPNSNGEVAMNAVHTVSAPLIQPHTSGPNPHETTSASQVFQQPAVRAFPLKPIPTAPRAAERLRMTSPTVLGKRPTPPPALPPPTHSIVSDDSGTPPYKRMQYEAIPRHNGDGNKGGNNISRVDGWQSPRPLEQRQEQLPDQQRQFAIMPVLGTHVHTGPPSTRLPRDQSHTQAPAPAPLPAPLVDPHIGKSARQDQHTTSDHRRSPPPARGLESRLGDTYTYEPPRGEGRADARAGQQQQHHNPEPESSRSHPDANIRNEHINTYTKLDTRGNYEPPPRKPPPSNRGYDSYMPSTRPPYPYSYNERHRPARDRYRDWEREPEPERYVPERPRRGGGKDWVTTAGRGRVSLEDRLRDP